MGKTRIAVVALMLLSGVALAQELQTPEQVVMARVAEAAQKADPRRTYREIWCSHCPPLVDAVGEVTGAWEIANDDREKVSVTISQMKTAEAAAKFGERALNEVAKGFTKEEAPKGWTEKVLQSGTGVLATYLDYYDSEGPKHYLITLWNGTFVIKINARSQERVDEFLRFVQQALAPKG